MNQPANKLKSELLMAIFWLLEKKSSQQLTNNKNFKFPLIFYDSYSHRKNQGVLIKKKI